MNIQQAIKAVIAKQDLSEEQMHGVMSDIMTGKTTDAQIGAFLVSAPFLEGISLEKGAMSPFFGTVSGPGFLRNPHKQVFFPSEKKDRGAFLVSVSYSDNFWSRFHIPILGP